MALLRVGKSGHNFLQLTQARLCHSGNKVLAIRREDNTAWERRAPLAPKQVRKLVQDGYNVLVQPSNRRAYPMQQYVNSGAQAAEDISGASTIFGVKNVPIDLLIPNKTYVFFSHTIKAQEANMALLDAVIEKQIRLIDYEKIVDSKGRRLVAFGKYAGVTGMINILHGLGLRLLALGHHTPFMHIGNAHNYRNSEMARQAIRDTGYEISLGMMPKSIGPLIFVFTGSGNVSLGAQEVFQELPHEYIKPDHLPSVAKHGSLNKVYCCVVDVEDHLVHKEGGPVNFHSFIQNPSDYYSVFHRKIAPYMSVLINGIYWQQDHPRLVTIPEAKSLLRPMPMPWLPSSDGCPQLPHRLLAICDISADQGGSIEIMDRCTTIDHPFILYDAETNTMKETFEGNGVLICSIDNMPAQIPRESTSFFGSLLMPYIPEIMKSDASTPFEQFNVSPIIKDSVIASNGKLTPDYEYIASLRKSNLQAQRSSKSGPMTSSSKKVLILGSGFVCPPVVDYLTKQSDVHVTVVSNMRDMIDMLAERFPNTTPVMADFSRSQAEVEQLVQDHNIVVSLLPAALHPDVAKMCIKQKTNLVTCSYATDAIRSLNVEAINAGITIVKEVGVDPGIDHMLAMQCFDQMKERGAKIKSFVSWCGGLPAPEAANNSLRYKFSWSPIGTLSNATAPGMWLEDGEVKKIPVGGALLDSAQPLSFLPGFNLEGYANRDSTVYTGVYGIETVTTILRGTLRYMGFSNAMKGLTTMGYLSKEAHPLLYTNGPDLTWRSFLCELLGQKQDLFYDSLKDIVLEKVNGNEAQLACMEELGLMSDELIDKRGSPLETLSNYLSKKLVYESGEKDLLIMRHDIGVEWPDGSTETSHIDFVVYGNPQGYTAMAMTVGYPTAIATQMVLDGEIQEKGIVLPLSRDVYKPILSRLEGLGLVAKEYSS